MKYQCGHCERTFKNQKECEKHEAKECEANSEVKLIPKMYLYVKDVEPLGFKGNGIFESKWHQFYYAKVPRDRKVYIIDDVLQGLSHFDLTVREWNAFEKGKLSLVPNGCCCASGGKYKDNPNIDFFGDWRKTFKTRRKTLEFIKKVMEGK